VASRIIKSAEELYAERAKDVAQKLETIGLKLTAHAEKERLNPKDYGFAGDLAHADQILGELLEFFGSNS
jgi:hypothetical protein